MEPRLEANLINWNSCVRVHAESQFYDVEGWLRNAPGPPSRETEALGDVAGKTLVHLQCHFGMDTLRWARAGATVTGLDFSPAAIDEATSLAERAGLSAVSYTHLKMVRRDEVEQGDEREASAPSLRRADQRRVTRRMELRCRCRSTIEILSLIHI